MIRRITFLSLLLMLSAWASAQFDPTLVRKSLVRVKVGVSATEANICTGFVWKTPNQIVTSLHAMNRGGEITVLYLNQAPRKAKIKKILHKADLVLLELLPGESAPPSGVVPLTTFNAQPIKFGTEVYAVGYNNGAQGSSSRTLKKGDIDPETLDFLIPKKDKTILAKVGFPALDLPIIYLEGSLLPGFSGAPVFDPQGRLIGVGDGGLEKGASNVSWIIPAKYLTELENSTTTSLPGNFEEIALLFSARVTVELSPEEASQATEVPAEEFYAEEADPVAATGFEFWLTKSRSLLEMAETSDDPERLLSITDYVESFNVKLGYDYLNFDIYEDINYGVILAVPEGERLFYNEEKDYFQVDYENNTNVDLFYVGWPTDNSESDFQEAIAGVLEVVPPIVEEIWAVGNFTVDQDFSVWREIDENRKIANILLISEKFEDAEFGGQSQVYLYITLLMSYDKSFIGIASFCMSDEQLNYAATNGVDCENYSPEECDYFENMIKVFSASHLTSFSY